MQKLTLTSFKVEKNCTVAKYSCDFAVKLSGDGLWGGAAGRRVQVSGIKVVTELYDDYLYVSVVVTHDSTWDIYTDSAFEAAISAALGMPVCFTEQGMQEDYKASMEQAVA